MKSITKMLPALGLVLGATMAMAMNFADPEVAAPEYGQNGSSWINVENLQIGEDYLCNDSDQVCTRSAPSATAPMVKEGTFEFLGE